MLGTLKSSEAETALASFFDELVAGKMAPGVQVDLVDAMQANGAPALEARLEAFRKTKGVDTVALAFRDALLQGGSVPRGRELFIEHPAAQCTRCHTVRNAGSDVGPNLTGVATRLTREQILESLLEPSARIAAGYGTVGITLKNGTRVDGTLRDETADGRRHRRGHAAGRADGSRRRRSPSARTPCPRCRPSASSSSPVTCGTWWRIWGR